MPSLRLPNAKYPIHLVGVKQWLKEDQLKSSMPWQGLEPGASASAKNKTGCLALYLLKIVTDSLTDFEGQTSLIDVRWKMTCHKL